MTYTVSKVTVRGSV